MAYNNANTGSREEQGSGNDTQRQGGTREGGTQGGRMDESNK